MKDRNIFAYTAPGSDLPEYISINRRDGEIVITVRSKRSLGSSGSTVDILLPQDQVDSLIYALRGARINPLLGSGTLSVPKGERQ